MRTSSPQLPFLNLLLLAAGFCSFTWLQAVASVPPCTSEDTCHAFLPPVVREFTPAGRAINPFIRKDLTNGERLARGLPLKAPSRRQSGPLARAPQDSPLPPVTYTGTVQVRNTDTNAIVGYLSTTGQSFGQIRYSTTEPALQIQFALSGTSGSQVKITMLNYEPNAPLLGLVQGRDDTTSDIGPTTFQYLYFDGVVSETSPGSPPVHGANFYTQASGLDRTVETDVWNIDLTTGAISAQWVNTDSSLPPTVLFSQESEMYAGGSESAFVSRYGTASNVRLQFIPA